MAASTITLWGTPETFAAFAITKAPEAAHEWDESAGRPSAAQMMRDGTPVWSAEALCGQGWAFAAFAITKAPEAAHEWDESAGRPSAAQMMRDGTPVWSAEALCGQGWAGDVKPVNLRILSATRPTLTVDPMKIAALYAPVSAASASASPSHAASSSSSSPSLPRRTA